MTREEYESMYREPLTPLQAKLMELDAALTGKNKDAEHGARQNRATPETLLFSGEPVYYLSDSGYSRIGFSFESRRLYLTSNSTEATRANWEACADLRREVESEMNAWLESQGY